MIIKNFEEIKNNFYPVIIIGSGPAGISLALTLEKKKIKCLIVEAGNEKFDNTIKQFMATGGMPPEGATLVSRYHNVDGTGGFAIVESSDAGALADYALDWNGMIEINITPLMDDETISKVLGAKFS